MDRLGVVGCAGLLACEQHRTIGGECLAGNECYLRSIPHHQGQTISFGPRCDRYVKLAQ
jgi:hypothetical protein